MQDRTRPIPETVETIQGYPSTLIIFKVPRSHYWQMRAYVGKLVKRSTKTEIKSKAIQAAKDFYNELLLRKSQNLPLTEGSTFKKTAESLLEEEQARVDRGERKQSLVDDFKYMYEADLYPFFKNDHVKSINYKRISAYVQHLRTRRERPVGSKTILNHFIQLRKILKHAHRMDLLDKMPIFPKVSTQDNPKAWFNQEQYETLQKAIRKAIKDKAVVRYVPLTDKLLNLTNFLVNSFLRPADIKILKNKDITVVKKPSLTYLRIMARGKVKAAQVITTQAAATIYERIKGDPEAYVFFPQYGRDHAMQIMAKQFKYVLEQAGLKKSDLGVQVGPALT